MQPGSSRRLAPQHRFCLLVAGLAACAAPALAQSAAAATAVVAGLRAEPAGALAAARQGLADFVARQREHGSAVAAKGAVFDVADLSELSTARIAYGLQVHTIAPQDILDGRTELARMVQPTGTWRFVVQAGARPVGLVTVHEAEDGRWQAVSFGAAGLAGELDALMAAHAGAPGATPRFIRVFQAQSDLLEIASAPDGTRRYALLRSARESLGQAGDAADDGAAVLKESHELLEPLRAAVKKSLAPAR